MSSKRADQSPEDKKMDLPVDLTSPRVQAAMRILGATVQNLSPRPLSDFKKEGMTESQEASAKNRHEKNEIRRKRLLQEIDETANALQEADVDALLSPQAASQPTSTQLPNKESSLLNPSMKDLFERTVDQQKAIAEETKRRSRAEIQRQLVSKIGVVERQEKNDQKNEDQKKVLADMRKEQRQAVKEAAEKRDKRHEKNSERLAEMQKAERIKMRELSTKLKETCDVAFEKAKQTRNGDEGKRQETRERMERILHSKNQFQEELRVKREESYERQIMNEQILADRRLEEKHEEMLRKQDEWGAKFTKKMNSVQIRQHEDKVKRETEYKNRAERLDTARERADELQKEKLRALAEEKTKRWNKLGANQLAKKEQDKNQLKELKKKVNQGGDAAIEAALTSRKDATQKLIDTRDTMTDMVIETKERIKRADDYARQQTIARVTSNVARVQALMEQKDFLRNQRIASQKDALIEKSKMQVTIENIKDPHPKKVNKILKSMDMPELPTGEQNLGEEAQENK